MVAQAGTPISFDTPLSFFTNVAARLLKAQVGLEWDRIRIYPTNQYTPAVHRILQVGANLYDATTNRSITDYPYIPSVFRPLFTNDAGSIYICGYEEVTNAALVGIDGPIPTMRDLTLESERLAIQSHDMVYGIPIVIGAKGLALIQ